MRWLKREDLLKKEKEEVEYFITLSDAKITKVTMNKAIKDIIKERGYTNLDFGFDEESKKLMVRLNKRSDGISLLSTHDTIRPQISAGHLVEVAKELGINLPTKERLTLTLTDAKGGHIFEVQHQKQTVNA